MAERTCSVDGCEKPHVARGWCSTHYAREVRAGLVTAKRRTADERFWEKVDKTDDCWLWTGKVSMWGYGRFYGPERRQVMAHRYSYERLVGPIPEGLQLDHLCRVRNCVRPDHLEPVTPLENSRRSPTNVTTINAAKTHCPRGHAYAEHGDVVRASGGGLGRICRTCSRERAAAARRRA